MNHIGTSDIKKNWVAATEAKIKERKELRPMYFSRMIGR
jgi:hypothetical protein